MTIFRQSFIVALVSLFIVTAVSGCVPLWIGAGVAGVVGGYSVSPDTVEGTSSHSLEECWDAAKEIVTIMGQIVQETGGGTQVEALINGSRVTVTLAAMSVSVTKIRVKARKAFLPKVDVAQDVYAKILSSMEK